MKERENTENLDKSGIFKGFGVMIKILFICHGSILKNPQRACKINDFPAGYGTYYTTTTPFFERALK